MVAMVGDWAWYVNTFPMLATRHGKVNVWATRSRLGIVDDMTPQHLVLLAKARRLAESGEGANARIAAGLSLRETADAIGVSPSALWRWEHGERSPRGLRAVAWARLVDELTRTRGAA